MLLGVIADDYTGASDIANTIAKGGGGSPGLATVQFLGVPNGKAPASCEAGVVALKSSSIPVAEAIAQSLAAFDCRPRQGDIIESDGAACCEIVTPGHGLLGMAARR